MIYFGWFLQDLESLGDEYLIQILSGQCMCIAERRQINKISSRDYTYSSIWGNASTLND